MRYFTKEVIEMAEMANKLMNQCSTSPATMKTQLRAQ